MGMDFFMGSNLSLKNPNFRSLRCGGCHAGGTLTDHTVEISHQLSFGDPFRSSSRAGPERTLPRGPRSRPGHFRLRTRR